MKEKQVSKGRRLKLATNRFLSMLIREAKDISSQDNKVLAEKLDLELYSLVRYAVYPPRDTSRAPLSMAQKLENRVATLLGRPSHPVVIECTHSEVVHGPGWPYWIDPRVSESLEINWRRDRDLPEAEGLDFRLGYGDLWPHYGQLSSSGGFKPSAPWSDQPELIRQFSFQWGVLWRRPSEYPIPDGMQQWQNREYLVPMGVTAEQFVEAVRKEVFSMSESLGLAAKVSETAHYGQGRMDRTVLYAMEKTISQAAMRSSDPLFLERFDLFFREGGGDEQ